MSLEKFGLTFKRLGSDWEIHYYADGPIEGLLEKLLDHVDHFCHLFSRFEEDSMLSRLNKNRSLETNDEFLKLFEKADEYRQKTEGIFNPLASPAHYGYTKNFDDGVFTAPDTDPPNLNWSEIKRSRNELRLASGQLLDFGGIGKGYLIDELSEIMRQYSEHFMISGGGDVWTESGKPDGEKWLVGVETPATGSIDYVISKKTGAVATSGTTRRRWGDYHHLIDPRTKKPAENIPEGLTVSADSACTADVGATTMICAHPTEYPEIAKKLGLEYGYFLDNKFNYTKGLGISFTPLTP